MQAVINVQVGNFLKKNKHTGLNKRTGGNLQNKNLTLHRAVLVAYILMPAAKHRY